MNQRIGYARVSADDPDLDLQRSALHLAGVASIHEEATSGKKPGRLVLDHCLGTLRAGDTLVVWRLDRLARSLPDLVHTITALADKGIGFESLAEKINTTSAAGKPVLHVFAALAAFERNLVRERSRVGLAAARARGRAGGRKPKLDTRQIKEIRQLMADPAIPVSHIAARYKVSRTTIYKVAPPAAAPEAEPRQDAP